MLHVPLAMAVLTGAHGTSCCPRGQGSQELASHRVIVSQCLAQQQTFASPASDCSTKTHPIGRHSVFLFLFKINSRWYII